ncbi:ABC transporter permease subunit [Ihubacter sp. mB4P-1]|uniref:ABC transporter permease subunit n=1 Tax=Ihubacter sp. mB4P-1 TaxID=3242370 RepID=UPI0013794F5F
MTALRAFTEKEFLWTVRTGKLMFLIILFVFFGVMNPAIAKMTPWLMETLAESLADSGLQVADTTVNALTSWNQFCKNIPMAMIVFLLLFSGILTSEYERGTLTVMFAKGLARWKVLGAKGIIMGVFWTAGYGLCFAVTWGYNRFFWNDDSAAHVLVCGGCYYLLGLWLITLILLTSVIFKTGGAVLAAAVCGFASVYLLGFLPAIKEYLPGFLFNAQALLTSAAEPADFVPVILTTLAISVFNMALALGLFVRRQV